MHARSFTLYSSKCIICNLKDLFSTSFEGGVFQAPDGGRHIVYLGFLAAHASGRWTETCFVAVVAPIVSSSLWNLPGTNLPGTGIFSGYLPGTAGPGVLFPGMNVWDGGI